MADQGRRLTLTCSIHGLLHETTVYCRHEVDDTMRSVQHAHGAVYGAGCTEGVLHVELDEAVAEALFRLTCHEDDLRDVPDDGLDCVRFDECDEECGHAR